MIASLFSVLKQIVALVMTIALFFSTGSGSDGKTRIPEQGYDTVKNVIYLIGDGMGENHLEKTKAERGISLAMETMPYRGQSVTTSKSSEVTDSAAGGTALSSGVRTYNGAIGVYMEDPLRFDKPPMNITELCAQSGMLTGIITTDKTSGATPAAFSAHSVARGSTMTISNQQISSDVDLIWGCATDYVSASKCAKNGRTLITTAEEMQALAEGSRSFAQFSGETWHTSNYDESTPTLSQMAVKAIDILDDTDEGFFLMIEGAHIDKNSHTNYDEGMTEALTEFDNTVRAVLDYAAADGETLVVITADHETGGIVLNADGGYSFTLGEHSSANVPVFVYGSDNFIENGEVLNNYELPIRIAYSLGFSQAQFPKSLE